RRSSAARFRRMEVSVSEPPAPKFQTSRDRRLRAARRISGKVTKFDGMVGTIRLQPFGGKLVCRLLLRVRRLKGGGTMSTILLIILILLLVGALPTWPYSSGWGYYPSGGLGLILLVVIILAVTGRL